MRNRHFLATFAFVLVIVAIGCTYGDSAIRFSADEVASAVAADGAVDNLETRGIRLTDSEVSLIVKELKRSRRIGDGGFGFGMWFIRIVTDDGESVVLMLDAERDIWQLSPPDGQFAATSRMKETLRSIYSRNGES